ncbi:hypothetical protein CAEBREN_17136 [Caenorhabditis brenneri]|uniref:Uncharacterized protein n=1 Tax=Caenorhabditis brenneri TaxID=135651 RepID=G0PEJ5_CAEBE|nr:hypothetical protein CAEBREN_17136 [Caenorhabditis brenneri]
MKMQQKQRKRPKQHRQRRRNRQKTPHESTGMFVRKKPSSCNSWNPADSDTSSNQKCAQKSKEESGGEWTEEVTQESQEMRHWSTCKDSSPIHSSDIIDKDAIRQNRHLKHRTSGNTPISQQLHHFDESAEDSHVKKLSQVNKCWKYIAYTTSERNQHKSTAAKQHEEYLKGNALL